jgi:phosphatidylinositol-3-phosphatase
MLRTVSLALAACCILSTRVHAATWTPDHVVVVIEENLSYRNLVPELTWLTRLMRENANFTDSHGIDHPSQPNYLALFSGNTQGTGSRRNPDGSNPIIGDHTQVGTDAPIAGTPLTSPNLAASLMRAGHSFAGYSEDLPQPGFTDTSHVSPTGGGIDYQRKHNPWVNWQAARDDAIGKNQLPSGTNLPFSAFPVDAAGFARLPTVAIVVPNQINDAHGSDAAPKGTTLRPAMDEWLRTHIEPFRQWAMTHNSLLVITWDEDEDDYTPVKDAAGTTVAKLYLNHVPTIMAGERVVPGSYNERIDHYTLLHTIEDFYGLTPFTDANAATRVISDAFRAR